MDEIRKAFEENCVLNFAESIVRKPRKKNGEYSNPVLEDHWQTFQEGWEAAIESLKNKHNENYTDLVSTSGMDPR